MKLQNVIFFYVILQKYKTVSHMGIIQLPTVRQLPHNPFKGYVILNTDNLKLTETTEMSYFLWRYTK